jgi:hypothetical protein
MGTFKKRMFLTGAAFLLCSIQTRGQDAGVRPASNRVELEITEVAPAGRELLRISATAILQQRPNKSGRLFFNPLAIFSIFTSDTFLIPRSTPL